MLSGIASTLLLPETMGRTLEDISDEDQNNFVKRHVVATPATVANDN